MACWNSSSAIIGIIAPAVGYSSVSASLFGAFFIGGGVLGSFVYATLLKKFRKWKLLLCAGSTTFGGLQILVFPLVNSLGLISATFMGFFMFSVMCVGFDLGVELTYPVDPSYSTGI